MTYSGDANSTDTNTYAMTKNIKFKEDYLGKILTEEDKTNLKDIEFVRELIKNNSTENPLWYREWTQIVRTLRGKFRMFPQMFPQPNNKRWDLCRYTITHTDTDVFYNRQNIWVLDEC
jgi:hypothetical protein